MVAPERVPDGARLPSLVKRLLAVAQEEQEAVQRLATAVVGGDTETAVRLAKQILAGNRNQSGTSQK